VTADEALTLRPSDRQLLELLGHHGEIDRAGLAWLSGLPRSTVTDSVARLQQHGLVLERAEPAAARKRPGRPRSLLVLAPPPGVIGVVSLTHESLHAGVLGWDGTLHSQRALDPYTPDSSLTLDVPGLDLLNQAVAATPHTLGEIKCLIVGMPLPVSPDQDRATWADGASALGSSLAAPYLPADPSSELAQALGVPVWLENDANLAAIGEGALGAATEMPSYIYIKIVHGIGAGLVLNHRLHRGARGLAGELAHLHVEDNGRVCRCGGRGCLMTTFSRRELADRIRGVHPEVSSMADVLSLAAQGDAGVTRLLRDLGRTLGRSLAEFCIYVAPDGVVIDGVLQNAATPVIDGIKEAMYQFAPPAIAAQVRIVVGALADSAELIGAAVLARHNMLGHNLLIMRAPSGLAVTPQPVTK
jgi:predicted NBD/HSP70 family sugar kinase